jgi:hypothetical protein
MSKPVIGKRNVYKYSTIILMCLLATSIFVTAQITPSITLSDAGVSTTGKVVGDTVETSGGPNAPYSYMIYVVNATHYAAKASNGTICWTSTNYTLVMINAANAATYGSVILPSGVLPFMANFTGLHDVTFIGQGYNSTTLRLPNDTNSTLLGLINCTNLKFEGIGFDGNIANNFHTYVDTGLTANYPGWNVYTYYSYNIQFERISSVNASTWGIFANCSTISVHKSVFPVPVTNNVTCNNHIVLMNDKSSSIEDNYFVSPNIYSACAIMFASVGSRFTHNTVEGGLRSGVSLEGNVIGAVITDNSFKDLCLGVTPQTATGGSATNCIISRNSFIWTLNSSVTGAALYVSGTFINSEFSGNTIKGYTTGIHIELSYNCSYIENNLDHCGTAIVWDGATSYTTIKDNNFYGCSTMFWNSTTITGTNNLIKDNQGISNDLLFGVTPTFASFTVNPATPANMVDHVSTTFSQGTCDVAGGWASFGIVTFALPTWAKSTSNYGVQFVARIGMYSNVSAQIFPWYSYSLDGTTFTQLSTKGTANIPTTWIGTTEDFETTQITFPPGTVAFKIWFTCGTGTEAFTINYYDLTATALT